MHANEPPTHKHGHTIRTPSTVPGSDRHRCSGREVDECMQLGELNHILPQQPEREVGQPMAQSMSPHPPTTISMHAGDLIVCGNGSTRMSTRWPHAPPRGIPPPIVIELSQHRGQGERKEKKVPIGICVGKECQTPSIFVQRRA